MLAAVSPQWRKLSPEVLEVRTGGGCLSLFGLPFLAAGLFMAGGSLGVLPVKFDDGGNAWARLVMFLMSVPFVAVGGGLWLGRHWIRVDLGRQTVTDLRGLLVPLRHKEQPLFPLDAVVLRHTPGDSDTAESFSIQLRGTGTADRQLASSSDFGAARAQAIELARFLRVPLVDDSGPRAVTLSAEAADMSWADRMRVQAAPLAPLSRPVQLTSTLDLAPGTVTIDIPGPPLRATAFLGVLIPFAILAYAVPSLSEFFHRTKTPSFVGGAFLGFLFLVFGVIPALSAVSTVVGARRRRTRVIATPGGVTIEERAAWRTKTTRIEGSDLYEVELGTRALLARATQQEAGERVERVQHQLSTAAREHTLRWADRLAAMTSSRGITLKAKHGLLTFGAGLPDEELAYLHALLQRALLGQT